jgi:DHA1 family multidrug resistance protein-like MFS transporter
MYESSLSRCDSKFMSNIDIAHCEIKHGAIGVMLRFFHFIRIFHIFEMSMEVWRRNLYILWGTQLLAMIGMNLVVPFLPFFIRELGVHNESELARWSGLVFAGPFLTAFIATPFWGMLGDRYGKKLMVVRAIFGLGVAQILIGLSQDVYQLLFFRVLQGAISGYIAAALSLISTSTPRAKIGYALGFLQSATAGGVVIGPAVGGVLADLIGYREIFFVTSALCFVGGLVIAKFVHVARERPADGQAASVLENFRFSLTNSQLRIIAITIVVSQGAALMIEPIFALFIEKFTLGTKYVSTITGGVFAIAGVFMVVSAPWWGNRNDRLGFKQNLIVALAGTGVAYSLHTIIPNLVTLGILRAGLGFVRGGILHALYSLTSVNAPPSRRSGLIGVASSFAILGNLLGPLAGGMIAANFGIRSVFIVNSCMFILLAYLIFRFLTEPPRTLESSGSELTQAHRTEEFRP